MFRIVTPISILHEQIERLRATLPGVYDGHLDSIHDARIATRRIREVLPLTHEWQQRHRADDLAWRFKRMGRSLGRVRDADTRLELLRHCQARIPFAAPALTMARQRETHNRQRRARKLIKRFERLSVDEEVARLIAAEWRRSQVWAACAGTWRGELRRLLRDRASAARDAVAHATGVYFPRRSHEARLAIKKLRYAAEIAAQVGADVDDAVIRDLKKTADILGDQHDRQNLLDELADNKLSEGTAADPRVDQARLIREVLEAEIYDLHGRYLARRPCVLQAAERLAPERQRTPTGLGIAAVAGVVALAGTGLIRRHRQASTGSPPDLTLSDDEDVAVRVAVPILGGRRN